MLGILFYFLVFFLLLLLKTTTRATIIQLCAYVDSLLFHTSWIKNTEAKV